MLSLCACLPAARAGPPATAGLAALGVLGGSAAKWTNVVWPIKSRPTNTHCSFIGIDELTKVGSDQRSSTIQYDSKSKHSKRRQTVIRQHARARTDLFLKGISAAIFSLRSCTACARVLLLCMLAPARAGPPATTAPALSEYSEAAPQSGQMSCGR